MKKLYLKVWEFNSYLIINKLAEIVKNNGGKIVTDFPYVNTYEKTEIVNRNIEENENEENANTNIQVLFKNYINFVLNDVVYYIQLQDNPFFEDYIIKEKAVLNNDMYYVKYNHYMGNLSKDWINNEENIKSYYETLTPKQIEKLANNLYNQILNMPMSEIVTTKKRVCNYYDNRYHYEYIKEERNKKYKILDIFESEAE